MRITAKIVLIFYCMISCSGFGQNPDSIAMVVMMEKLNYGELKLYVTDKVTGKPITDELIIESIDREHIGYSGKVKPKDDGLVYLDDVDTGTYEILIYLLPDYGIKKIKGVSIKKHKTTTINCALETREYLYKYPDTLKVYQVKTDRTTNKDKTVTYKVGDEVVSQEVYDKFNYRESLETCCPCLVQIYNRKDQLITEAFSCTDCRIGNYKEFYPNGKLKVQGQYKENKIGYWLAFEKENPLLDGYDCGRKTGEWIYFDDGGNILYKEFWKNGEFIKQVPEQKNTEMWYVEVELKGKKPFKDSMSLAADEVKLLKIIPKYKNNSREGAKLKIKFEVQGEPYNMNAKEYVLTDLKSIDIKKMIKEANIQKGKPVHCYLTLDYNEYYRRTVTLYLKP